MENKKEFNNNGHKYVDLDLPSGTLWATMNIGANKPSDFGQYFQWGGIVGYTKEQIGFGKGQKVFAIDWNDYKWYKSGTMHNPNFNKYTTVGAKLELEDDAAHINMGGDWHIPTPEQIKELIRETTNTFVRHLIGTNGRLFTSKKDPSKSIFIPDASCVCGGYIFNSQCFGDGDGNIWSSMLSADDVKDGQRLFFSTHYVGLGNNRRYKGLPVRGVIG